MKILACIVALLLLGGAVVFAQNKSQTPSPSQTTLAPGRYQIVMNPNIARDTFLLDTQTGRVWVETEVTNIDGHPHLWKIEDRVDNQEQFTEWSTSKLEIQNYQHAVEKAAKDAASPNVKP